jgi:phenylpyruvate tautomerase PptA (4-oxalocrotonate tautomerase family)
MTLALPSPYPDTEEDAVPYIQCEIQAGLSAAQKTQLAKEITRITHEVLGSPLPYIHVAVREVAGSQFVEAGQIRIGYGGE